MLWGSRLKLRVLDTPSEVAVLAAQEFLQLASPTAVFGFATGNTPLSIYAELSKHGPLQCSGAFSLDEYLGLGPNDKRSFAWYVRHRIEPALQIAAGSIHVPIGDAPDIEAECERFESLVRNNPIDLQLLGTGRNGHIAFNEPGSDRNSLTRVVQLDRTTRIDNGADFGGLAPERAITQGVATIMRAKRVLLVATGAAKKEPIARLLSKKVDSNWPVTYLAEHPDLVVLADSAAVD